MHNDDIQHRFTNHPPKDASVGAVFDHLTATFIATGNELVATLPEGREKSLALTKLEECSFWSKAAVARGQ